MHGFENSKERNFSKMGQVTSSVPETERWKKEGGEEMRVEEASPGELHAIDRIPTRQDALKTD